MADSKKKSKRESGEAASTGSKKKAQRSGSNVFAMFSQQQVQIFKEAFQMIDQDKDGFISKNDIRQTFDALGRLCTEEELNSMIAEAPGPINFTMFITIFGDRAQGTDDETVILNAFSQYDEGDGTCREDVLKHSVMTWGEKFTEAEWDTMTADAPMVKDKIDVKKWAKMITGSGDDDNK